MELLAVVCAASSGPLAQVAGVGGSTLIVIALLAVGAIATGLVLWLGRAHRRARDKAFIEAKDCAGDDLAALDDDLHALREELDAPGAPIQALDDATTASSAYDRAERAWKAACEPDDLEPVSMGIEESRWALACARARLHDDELPLRRPPCFFHPGHGPSVTEAEWHPPFGKARRVPVCEGDANRVERGLEPELRQVPTGTGHVPYYDAGPAHAPYVAGFFGGRGGTLLPPLLHGSALGVSLEALARRSGADGGGAARQRTAGESADAGGLASDFGGGD